MCAFILLVYLSHSEQPFPNENQKNSIHSLETLPSQLQNQDISLSQETSKEETFAINDNFKTDNEDFSNQGSFIEKSITYSDFSTPFSPSDLNKKSHDEVKLNQQSTQIRIPLVFHAKDFKTMRSLSKDEDISTNVNPYNSYTPTIDQREKLRQKLDKIYIEKMKKEEIDEEPIIKSYKPLEGEAEGGFNVKIYVENITWKILYCRFNLTTVSAFIGKKSYKCPVPQLDPGKYVITISHNHTQWIEVGTITLKGSMNPIVLFIFFAGLTVGSFSLYKAVTKIIHRKHKGKLSDDAELYAYSSGASGKSKGNRLTHISTL